MSHITDDLPLPYGWIREVDPATDSPFYVDTRAVPPRSTWYHPFEDEQFLNEYPEIRDVMRALAEADAHERNFGTDVKQPEAKPPRHPQTANASPNAIASSSSQKPKKAGFVEKIKYKTTGKTKEERRAARYAAQVERERQDALYYQQQAAYPVYPGQRRRHKNDMLLPVLALAGGVLLGGFIF